jgi:regulator of cell morphogenesis and NO signaling
MTITETTTIADVAASQPSSVRIFQRHGIDLGCGGKRPIGLVCEEQGLSLAAIAAEIDRAAAEPREEERDWGRVPLQEIIDHIVSTYHAGLRADLPRIETMATRVVWAHGRHSARLLGQLEATLDELSSALHEHMAREEAVLFPAIRALEQTTGPVRVSISDAVHVTEMEHDRVGALLAELRTITQGYAIPEWGCETVRGLYCGLAAMEAAVHEHVHLENNVLFPRALELAGDVPTLS